MVTQYRKEKNDVFLPEDGRMFRENTVSYLKIVVILLEKSVVFGQVLRYNYKYNIMHVYTDFYWRAKL